MGQRAFQLLQPQYQNDSAFTFNNTYVEDHNIRITNYGKIAVFQGWFRLKTAPPSGTNIITGLPEILNPAVIMGFDQNHTSVIGFSYNNNGDFQAINSVNYSQSVMGYINFDGVVILK